MALAHATTCAVARPRSPPGTSWQQFPLSSWSVFACAHMRPGRWAGACSAVVLRAPALWAAMAATSISARRMAIAGCSTRPARHAAGAASAPGIGRGPILPSPVYPVAHSGLSVASAGGPCLGLPTRSRPHQHHVRMQPGSTCIFHPPFTAWVWTPRELSRSRFATLWFLVHVSHVLCARASQQGTVR
jgi:hypothetical protein